MCVYVFVYEFVRECACVCQSVTLNKWTPAETYLRKKSWPEISSSICIGRSDYH